MPLDAGVTSSFQRTSVEQIPAFFKASVKPVNNLMNSSLDSRMETQNHFFSNLSFLFTV